MPSKEWLSGYAAAKKRIDEGADLEKVRLFEAENVSKEFGKGWVTACEQRNHTKEWLRGYTSAKECIGCGEDPHALLKQAYGNEGQFTWGWNAALNDTINAEEIAKAAAEQAAEQAEQEAKRLRGYTAAKESHVEKTCAWRISNGKLIIEEEEAAKRPLGFVEEVCVWRISDGTLIKDREEAMAREAVLNMDVWYALHPIFNGPHNGPLNGTVPWEEVKEWIVEHHEHVRTLLEAFPWGEE